MSFCFKSQNLSMMFSEDQLHMEGMLCDKKAVQLLPAPEGGLALRALSLHRKEDHLETPCWRGHRYTSGSTVSAQPALNQPSPLPDSS